MVFPGKNMATNPNTMKMINATNSTPLHTVKSNFVWNANSVSARHTTAVAPTAIITVSGGTLAVIMPSINDWATVKRPSIMKLVGDVRRTLSQHAIAIIVPNKTTIDIQNNSVCCLTNKFVPLWKTHREINPNETLNWTWDLKSEGDIVVIQGYI